MCNQHLQFLTELDQGKRSHMINLYVKHRIDDSNILEINPYIALDPENSQNIDRRCLSTGLYKCNPRLRHKKCLSRQVDMRVIEFTIMILRTVRKREKKSIEVHLTNTSNIHIYRNLVAQIKKRKLFILYIESCYTVYNRTSF